MEDANASSAHESEAVKLEEDELFPLSDKPFFDVVLTKTNFDRWFMVYVPNKMLQHLPPGPCEISTVLTYRGKSWSVTYKSGKRHYFAKGWKAFSIDNNLKEGDACIFELSKSSASELKFRVQILRGDFPSELLEEEAVETPGTIVIID